MADVNSTPGRTATARAVGETALRRNACQAVNTQAMESPSMDSKEIKPPETAFTPFAWMGADKLQGAAVDGRNLIALVNHAQDVAMGVAAIMELTTAHSLAEDSGDEPYLSRYDLGRLERLAIRALHGLSEHSEEIARGAS